MSDLYNPTPDQINAKYDEPVYRCRVCRIGTGLHWFGGTSCPVCSKPECIKFCKDEYAAALRDAYDQEEE